LAHDRAIGVALVIGAIIGVLVYGFLVFGVNATVSRYVLEITAFVAVLAILAILGWIGYVMATTPPPVPLEPEPATPASSSGSPQEQSGSQTPEKKTTM
jgi:predicted DNA-binding transcriptional regulator